jgi:hypothetical protein
VGCGGVGWGGEAPREWCWPRVAAAGSLAGSGDGEVRSLVLAVEEDGNEGDDRVLGRLRPTMHCLVRRPVRGRSKHQIEAPAMNAQKKRSSRDAQQGNKVNLPSSSVLLLFSVPSSTSRCSCSPQAACVSTGGNEVQVRTSQTASLQQIFQLKALDLHIHKHARI